MTFSPFRYGDTGGGLDPVAAVLARQPDTGSISPSTVPVQPFVWGAGGQQLSPEQLKLDRQIAASLYQPDYSPVSSLWEGAGRVFDNVRGGIGFRDARAADAQQQQALQAALGASLGPGNQDIARLLMSGSPTVASIADNIYAQRTRPAQPHYWETNNGSLGMIGPDGTPQIVYQDPTPKIDWIQAKDPNTGQITLYPMQQGGGGPASNGMGAGIPSGSPLEGWPPPEAISELMRNPSTASQFDEVFGSGAASKILGKP
ncbi:MAG: hypothetical protein J7498_05525 [Sphingobium sp.]|nr:hypothetical protein [Sphingobium sp.]